MVELTKIAGLGSWGLGEGAWAWGSCHISKDVGPWCLCKVKRFFSLIIKSVSVSIVSGEYLSDSPKMTVISCCRSATDAGRTHCAMTQSMDRAQ
jgi:hypothetical protein